MSKINYRGSIFSQIEKAFFDNPEMTVGEILFSFLHKTNFNGRHFFYCDDEQILSSIEAFNKNGVEKDEPLDEQGFEFWAEQKYIVK